MKSLAYEDYRKMEDDKKTEFKVLARMPPNRERAKQGWRCKPTEDAWKPDEILAAGPIKVPEPMDMTPKKKNGRLMQSWAELSDKP